MSDETVKPGFVMRYSVILEEGAPSEELVHAKDYDKLEAAFQSAYESRNGLRKLLEDVRAALGIGPGTDVVRAAERARAECDRYRFLKDWVDTKQPGELYFSELGGETGAHIEVLPGHTLDSAIDAARRAEGELS